MLRIHCSKGSAAACVRYFDQHLTVGDYYFEGAENEPSQWHGKGAERLGLSGLVVRNQFHALLQNLHPHTGQKLTPRQKTNRRCGYDFGFSVPKGVSIAYLIGEDTRIKDAFLEAVRHTMTCMEREAKSRFRDKGADYDITTGNLVWSEHLHKTARPVNGLSDPHLHMHCYVQNMTYREDKKRFMALQVGDLKRDAPRFQQHYFKRLQANLVALGYEIESTGKGWDIAGISQALKTKFSRRSAQIEQKAKELNITDPAQKAQLGATTRESKKIQKLSYDKQKAAWRLSAAIAGFNKRQCRPYFKRPVRQSLPKQTAFKGTTLRQKMKQVISPKMSQKTWEAYNRFEGELKQATSNKREMVRYSPWRDFER